MPRKTVKSCHVWKPWYRVTQNDGQNYAIHVQLYIIHELFTGHLKVCEVLIVEMLHITTNTLINLA